MNETQLGILLSSIPVQNDTASPRLAPPSRTVTFTLTYHLINSRQLPMDSKSCFQIHKLPKPRILQY